MNDIFKKALGLVAGDSAGRSDFRLSKKRPLKKLTERQLLELESQIGARLFGEIPAGRRREFFCLDQDTWIWHEEWSDPKTGQKQSYTTRYEVQDKGILKIQGGSRYAYLEGQELDNLVLSVGMYYEQVARGVYSIDPATGQKLG